MTEGMGLDAPITGVTVFRDGARVQRSGTVSMVPGRQAVVVGGLPAGLDPASVRVGARGPGLTLLNVEVHRGYRTDPLREEVARLRGEAERCRDAVRALDDEDTAVQAHLDFLGHLSGAAATALARAVGFGRAGHDELGRMAGHLSADTADALGRRRDIGARSRVARRELEAAERRLDEAERRAGQPAAYAEVSAILEAGAATPAQVELSYHVPGASWRPLYDLTLDGEQLAVSYLAEVTQQTGEDWPAVELVLATTRRGRFEGLPELDPWYIGKAVPPPAMPRARKALASPRPAPRRPLPHWPVPHQPTGRKPRCSWPSPATWSGRAWFTGCSARWPCRPTADRTRPASAGSTSTPRSTISRCRCSPPRPTCGRPLPTARRCCSCPARPGSSTGPSSSGRPPWRPWPRARSSSCSSAWTTRSGWSASCAAGARARPSSAARARSTSATR